MSSSPIGGARLTPMGVDVSAAAVNRTRVRDVNRTHAGLPGKAFSRGAPSAVPQARTRLAAARSLSTCALAGFVTGAIVRSARRWVSTTTGGEAVGDRGTDPGWTREIERQFLHGTVLQTLEAVCAPDSHTRIELLRAQAASDARKLRAYLRGYCPASASGFGAMLEELITEANYKGLSVDVIQEGRPEGAYALAPQVLAALQSAATEVLTNVAKHAGVTSVTLRHVSTDEGLTLSIADAGSGFDPTDPANRGGFGLSHTIGGISRVGGSARIDATPGGGTLVYLTVPFAEAARRDRQGDKPW